MTTWATFTLAVQCPNQQLPGTWDCYGFTAVQACDSNSTELYCSVDALWHVPHASLASWQDSLPTVMCSGQLCMPDWSAGLSITCL